MFNGRFEAARQRHIARLLADQPSIEEPKQETLEKTKDLAYWKANAEDYINAVPISVLRYITELEKKMYDKEDLRAAWMAAKNSSDFNEWFEQFKKK